MWRRSDETRSFAVKHVPLVCLNKNEKLSMRIMRKSEVDVLAANTEIMETRGTVELLKDAPTAML